LYKEAKSIPLIPGIQIHNCSLVWLGTDTTEKNGRLKLVLWVCIEYVCHRETGRMDLSENIVSDGRSGFLFRLIV